MGKKDKNKSKNNVNKRQGGQRAKSYWESDSGLHGYEVGGRIRQSGRAATRRAGTS